MSISDEQYDFLTIQMYVLSFGLDLLLTGIYTCIIFFIIYFFCSSRRCRAQRTSKILTGVILLMFAIRMIHIGIYWYGVWFALVKHGESRDEVISTLGAAFPNLVLSNVTTVLLTAIADSVMVWRCWVICSSSMKVTFLPFVLNFIAIVFGLTFVSFGPVTPPIVILMSTLNLAFSAATTISATLIIAIRILMVGKVPGNAKPQSRYSKPLAIIIESSALYTVALIVDMPFYAIISDFTDTTYQYVDTIAQNMTVIAPALIMLRVLMVKALPEEPEHQSQSRMTTLRFENGGINQSEHSNADPTLTSRVIGEDNMDAGQSDRQSEKEMV